MSDLVFDAAPPASPPRRPVAPVLISGLSTSVFALLGIWSINKVTDDFNVMGWYAWYVLPVGALLVGALSATGYGFASWRSGVKISRGLLWAVLGLQVLAYFAAQYVSFIEEIAAWEARGYAVELGFFQWFDETARSFAWKESGGGAGTALGAWGYAFRVLEIAGFALGGAFVPLMLGAKPYCDGCQRYRRSLKQIVLPVGKMEPVTLPDGRPDVVDAALQGLSDLLVHVQAEQPVEYRARLSALQQKRRDLGKSVTMLQVFAHVCPSCRHGYIAPRIVRTEGQNVQQTDLDQTWFSAAFGAALLGR